MRKLTFLLLILVGFTNCPKPAAQDDVSSSFILALLGGSGTSSSSTSNTLTLTCSNSSSSSSLTLTAGTAMTTFYCNLNSFNVSSLTFSISPSLPSGLTSTTSSTTLTISGTPTAIQTKTSYTVTANSSGGSATATFDITINPSAPTFVSTIFSTYVIGISTSVSIVKGGCIPCTFSVTPTLPSGLSLNTTTGVVSGTPTAAQSATTYSVTASNSAGSITSTSTSLTIVPVSVVYSGLILYYPISTSVSITPTTTSATTVTYSLTSGSLPSGISLSSSTGAITGTTPASASTNSITIRGTNTAGNANSNLLSFRVHTVADLTCNTSGTAAGCTGTAPFSCNASSLCYGSLTSCRQTAPTGSCQY